MSRPSQQQIVVRVHAQPPRLLDIPRCADYLSSTCGQIEVLMRGGELRYSMVGAKRVVDKADLDAWCDKLTKETGKRREPSAVAAARERARLSRQAES
jgi:hypothetical protein